MVLLPALKDTNKAHQEARPPSRLFVAFWLVGGVLGQFVLQIGHAHFLGGLAMPDGHAASLGGQSLGQGILRLGRLGRWLRRFLFSLFCWLISRFGIGDRKSVV